MTRLLFWVFFLAWGDFDFFSLFMILEILSIWESYLELRPSVSIRIVWYFLCFLDPERLLFFI